MEHLTGGAKIGLKVFMPANQGSMGGQGIQDIQDSPFQNWPSVFPFIRRTREEVWACMGEHGSMAR